MTKKKNGGKSNPENSVRQLEILKDDYEFAEQIKKETKLNQGIVRPLYEILEEFIHEGANHFRKLKQGGGDKQDEPILTEAEEVGEFQQETTLERESKTWNEVVKFNSLLNMTKSQVVELKKQFVQFVEEGYGDPLHIIATINAFQKVFEGDQNKPGVRKMLTELALKELSQYKDGEYTVGNFKITSMEAGTKYDYSHDPVWNELDQMAKNAELRRKDRETFLKGVKAPDPLTGREPQTELVGDEIIELRPPVKKSTTTVKCTPIR